MVRHSRKSTRDQGPGKFNVCVKRLQTYLEYLQSPRLEKKWKIIPGTYVFPTETRGDYFWTF